MQLKEHWGISALHIAPVKLGRARNTWTFQVTSPTGSFFLKLKKVVSEAGIAVSRLLAEGGVRVAEPSLSVHGRSWERVGDLSLLVFPLLTGSSVKMPELTEDAWRAIGSALCMVHDAPLPQALKQALSSETFEPAGRDLLQRLQRANLQALSELDGIQGEFITLWLASGSAPSEFFEMVKRKGEAALLSEPSFCLCHGDFQAGNIFLSEQGAITLLDWDNPLWAPREVDLMFIPPAYEAQFRSGYGKRLTNQTVLNFQSSNWVLQEALDCADRILFTRGTDLEQKQWAFGLAASMLERMRAALNGHSGRPIS